MVNINDFLTDKQIEMLLNDIGSNDLVALFFMDDTEKFDYLSIRKNLWFSKYNYYNKFFDQFSEKQALFEVNIDAYRSFCEELDSLVLSIQHCVDLMSVYQILLDHIR